MQALLADLQEISLEPLTSSCFDTDAIGLALHKLINDVMKRRNELLSAVFIVRLQQALTPSAIVRPTPASSGIPYASTFCEIVDRAHLEAEVAALREALALEHTLDPHSPMKPSDLDLVARG